MRWSRDAGGPSRSADEHLRRREGHSGAPQPVWSVERIPQTWFVRTSQSSYAETAKGRGSQMALTLRVIEAHFLAELAPRPLWITVPVNPSY
jgi:hypothetical protein